MRCGHRADETVAGALARVLPACGAEHRVVIRSIDSARSLEHLRRALEFHHVPYEVVHDNVSVAIPTLRTRVEELFTGFDEVWIFAGSTPPFDLGSLPRASSDGTDFSAGVPPALLDAMQKTRCVLVLGDGCGLNYAVDDERVPAAFSI